MEQKNEKPIQPVQQVYIAYPQTPDDNLGINTILQGLKDNKKILLLFFSIFVIGAAFVAATLPSWYRTEVVLRPPQLKDIESFNIPVVNELNTKIEFVYEIDGIEIFFEFLNNLRSTTLQKESFRKKISSEYQTSSVPFGKIFISDARFKKDKISPVKVTITGRSPKLLAENLNNLISYVNVYTTNSIEKAIIQRAENLVRLMEDKISGLRKIALERRLDQIRIYEEARLIADKLGIHESQSVNGAYRQEVRSNSELLIETFHPPLFLRGTNILDIEIEILKKRKNDDPFIPELRELQEDVAFYSMIKVPSQEVSTVNIDTLASVPTNAFKPKRLLLFTMGVVLGSILTALIGTLNHILKSKINEATTDMMFSAIK